METMIDYSTGEIVNGDDVWQRHRRIVNLRNEIEQNYLLLAKELFYAYENKDWKKLGHSSFNAYLGDSEVDIARKIAFMLIDVYERYILTLEAEPVPLLTAGYTKLHMLCPYINKDNVNEWLTKATSLSRSDLKHEIEEAFPQKQPPPPPAGKYRVIYADPPWAYNNSGFDQSAESQYPTMPIEDICALPIGDLADENCVLFLWATSPLLPEAIRAIRAWGFEYKASRVWIKNRAPGIGWFVHTRHELLLIAVRGQAHPKEKLDSVFQAEVGRHSAKPHLVYDDIEFCYDGPYIELFARNERDDWTSWGNEI